MSETQTPPDRTTTMLASVEAGIRALQDRLSVGIGDSPSAPAAQAIEAGLSAVQGRLAEVEGNLAQRIAGLETRPPSSPAALEAGLQAVQTRLAEMEANLVRRITRLESQLNQLRNAHTIYLGGHEALTRLYTGHRIYVDTRDVGICSHLMLEGRWEPWIEKVIAGAVKPGMTFCDVGANFGYYTLLGAAWVGGTGKVYSFEANPQIYRHLRKSVSINGFDGHVTLHNLAVHSEAATLRFSYTDEYSGGGSTMGGPQGSHQVEVRAAPLDTLLASVPRVDVMKVDVEGSEPYVFQGARALMDRSPDLTLIVEFHEGSTRPILPPLQYLQGFIDQGFALALIEPAGLTQTMTAEQCLQTLRGDLGYLYLTRGAAAA